MKCDNCGKKGVKELHSLYEEQPYNEKALKRRTLDKLIGKGILWLCKECFRKATR